MMDYFKYDFFFLELIRSLKYNFFWAFSIAVISLEKKTKKQITKRNDSQTSCLENNSSVPLTYSTSLVKRSLGSAHIIAMNQTSLDWRTRRTSSQTSYIFTAVKFGFSTKKLRILLKKKRRPHLHKNKQPWKEAPLFLFSVEHFILLHNMYLWSSHISRGKSNNKPNEVIAVNRNSIQPICQQNRETLPCILLSYFAYEL